MMSGSFGMGWGGGWPSMGMIPMVIWWALIIALVVALAKWLGSGTVGGVRDGADRALEILAERYARGEIRKDEFDAKRHDLRAPRMDSDE